MEDAADKFPKDIAAMEQNWKRLEETGAEIFFRGSCYAPFVLFR